MLGISRVYASSMDSVRNLRPLASASCKKSIVHVSFARVGAANKARAWAQIRLLRRRRRTISFSST